MRFAISLTIALSIFSVSVAQAATTKSHKQRRALPHHAAVAKHEHDRSHYRFPMHHGDDY